MTRNVSGWFVPVVLLGVTAYALAEDLTLTTYYPSPRGVYKELRTSGDVAIGSTGTPTARLHVVGSLLAPALYVVGQGGTTTLRVDDHPDAGGDASPFLINSDGAVGIGTMDPGSYKLRVQGAIKLTGNLVDASSQVIYDQGTQKIPEDRLPFKKGDLIAPADRPIIAGLGTYTTQYFSLANLGISGTQASNVKSGVTFGPGNAISGTATASLASATKVNVFMSGTIGECCPDPVTATATCPAGKQIVASGRGMGVGSSSEPQYLHELQAANGVIGSLPVSGCEGQTSCSESTQSDVGQPAGVYLRVLIFCE